MSGAVPTVRSARRWVVCADDFALDRGTIEGTLALIKMGRVTATSVLVDSPNWVAAAPELKAVADKCDVGLHLNLTEVLEPGSTRWPLSTLVIQSVLRVIPRWRLHNLIDRQLDAFADRFGRFPDFIDGHHHVHHLPVVREELVDSVLARQPKTLPWLRICLPPEGDEDYKARVIALLGADGLAELAREEGFPASRCLVGVYRFDLQRSAYLAKVRQWLGTGPDGTVFMCHPSARPSSKDPIGAARRVELGVLAGETYADLVARSGVTISRGTTIFKARPPTLKPRE